MTEGGFWFTPTLAMHGRIKTCQQFRTEFQVRGLGIVPDLLWTCCPG